MLDILKSEQFKPLIDRHCELVSDTGQVLATTLSSVREVPSARDAAAVEHRMPFNLVFVGPADTPLADGIYTLRLEDLEVPGVFLSRIVNLGPQPASRFQAVFT